MLLEQEASESYLKGILGFETRPLVSTDYVNDARSSIVDAACTQVRSPRSVLIPLVQEAGLATHLVAGQRLCSG